MDLEKELREGLGIRLVQCPLPEAWSEHLLKPFQQIQSFKDYDISTYPTKTPSGSSRLVYRNETVARAKRTATTAKRIVKAGIVSEMEWRLRLEELALARFRLEIDCPNELCERRIWRSEVEVLVEKPGTPEHHVRSRKAKAPPAHEVFKGAANKSAIQLPSQQIPGRSFSELEAATTESILTGYQEFLAKNASLLVQQSANPGIQSAVEPSEQPHHLSSHPNPRRDLSHANPVEPRLRTISALDFPPQSASSSAETTPVPPLTRSTSPEPSILSTPSTPRTRSAAPSPAPLAARSKFSGSSKRPLILGDDREISAIHKRLKACTDLVDKEVIIID